MKIKQVYEIVNDAQKQVLGTESLLQEDLSDVVSIGDSIANMNLYDKLRQFDNQRENIEFVKFIEEFEKENGGNE